MSAYDNHKIYKFNEGDKNLVRSRFLYKPSINDRVHEVIEGDRLDTIAYKFLGDSKLWYIIADTNDIINPFELEIGQVLIIPENHGR